MFSGIIIDVGIALDICKKSQDWKIQIQTSLETEKISVGDSIACDGICLTVVEILNDSFIVQTSLETQNITNLIYWHKGYRVNLETALRIGDLLNGHFVQGHVDCCTKVLKIEGSGDSQVMQFALPQKLKKYIVYKGSIAVNGVSLTINSVDDATFFVNIIPHTLNYTNLSELKVDSFVNIEVDLLARYLFTIA